MAQLRKKYTYPLYLCPKMNDYKLRGHVPAHLAEMTFTNGFTYENKNRMIACPHTLWRLFPVIKKVERIKVQLSEQPLSEFSRAIQAAKAPIDGQVGYLRLLTDRDNWVEYSVYSVAYDIVNYLQTQWEVPHIFVTISRR